MLHLIRVEREIKEGRRKNDPRKEQILTAIKVVKGKKGGGE